MILDNISNEEYKKRVRLHKIAVAHSDITNALYTTRLFLKTVEDMRDENFLVLQDSIFISYARPFSDNKPYGKLSSNWGKFFDPTLQRLHDDIVEYRNKLVAHSDKRKVRIVPPSSDSIPGVSASEKLSLDVSSTKFTIESFKVVEQLCLDLGNRLNTEMFSLLEELFGKKELPSHPFELL